MNATAQANAVRPSAFRHGRVIAVNCTPHAPRGGWPHYTMFGPPLTEAVKVMLERLARAPAEIRAADMKLGDVALLTARAGEPRAPLAFVWEGCTAAEINAELDQLARAGWRP